MKLELRKKIPAYFTHVSFFIISYFSVLPPWAKYAKFNFPTKMWPSKLYVTNDPNNEVKLFFKQNFLRQFLPVQI